MAPSDGADSGEQRATDIVVSVHVDASRRAIQRLIQILVQMRIICNYIHREAGRAGATGLRPRAQSGPGSIVLEALAGVERTLDCRLDGGMANDGGCAFPACIRAC